MPHTESTEDTEGRADARGEDTEVACGGGRGGDYARREYIY